MDAKFLAGLAALAMFLFATPAPGQTIGQLAGELSRAAAASGLHRVAVARFESTAGRPDSRGEHVDESLTVALVRGGRVQTIERSQVPRLAEELYLDRTGLIDGGQAREINLAPVEGLVVGHYQIEGGRMRVYARVVRLSDGLIVGAGRADLAVEVEAPRPSVEPDGCAEAAARVDRMQAGALDLKVRFWAFRLRLGEDLTMVTRNPGSTIPGSALRERFYEALKARASGEPAAPMTELELRSLERVERESEQLMRECGL
jgi:hypothetical protein